MAYASQEPWIFSGTVKENVLFGASYNADWYNRVVEACALDTVSRKLYIVPACLVSCVYRTC